MVVCLAALILSSLFTPNNDSTLVIETAHASASEVATKVQLEGLIKQYKLESSLLMITPYRIVIRYLRCTSDI